MSKGTNFCDYKTLFEKNKFRGLFLSQYPVSIISYNE